MTFEDFDTKLRNTDFVRRDCSCMDLRFGHDNDCAGPERPVLTKDEVVAMHTAAEDAKRLRNLLGIVKYDFPKGHHRRTQIEAHLEETAL